MTSDIMMKGLLMVYLVIATTCVLEKNYPKALYWTSAGMITLSVLWGMK
jgi:hypothetical protein